jgi:PIN domain nuclease of toxin-antitoxin system
MRYLLDTHLLLWAGQEPERLSTAAQELIRSEENTLFFSAVSMWEIAIKAALKRPDLEVDPERFYRQLLATGYLELHVTSAHAVALRGLSEQHKDPFDRLLLAQAIHENIILATVDRKLAAYDGPVLRV